MNNSNAQGSEGTNEIDQIQPAQRQMVVAHPFLRRDTLAN